MLRIAPLLTIGFLILPVLAGLGFVIVPALGYAPVLGLSKPLFSPFADLMQVPGIGKSVWLSLWIGPATALVSLALAFGLTAAFSGTRLFGMFTALIKPVIAVPHAAAAIGLAFLVAPSGFLVRLASPELTGFTRPPDWLIVNDPAGLALFAGLVLKEMPFLLLVIIAALPQTDERLVRIARNGGRGRIWAFTSALFPAIYRQIRLPVFAVIAFASSVVDMALILGPGTPPTLAVQVLRLMNDPDLAMRLVAAAGALTLLGVTLFGLGVWYAGERLAAHVFQKLALGGWRSLHDGATRFALGAMSLGILLALLLGLLLLALWSFSGYWPFAAKWPGELTLNSWNAQTMMMWPLLINTLVVGFAAAITALVLVLGCLEYEFRNDIRLSPLSQLVLYLPLLVPQLAFLAGLGGLMVYLRWDGTWWAVALTHLVFVLPYAYLLLADAYRAIDQRYFAIARLLGHSPAMVFWRIRLPLALRPILLTLAMSFAISVAQYLPTLLIGAGRVPTLTTEAVALASGGNRRLIGIYALMQSLLPFIALALAALVPTLVWRNRQKLQPGAQTA